MSGNNIVNEKQINVLSDSILIRIFTAIILILKMKTAQLYISTIILLLFCPSISFGQYFKSIDMKDGLSNLSVLSIYQDTLGRMWFGTNEGVNVYDGTHIEKYKVYEITDNHRTRKTFISGPVYEIVGNAEGDIFMRVDNALIQYEIKQEKFRELRTSNVNTLAVWDGELWYATSDSLFHHISANGIGG